MTEKDRTLTLLVNNKPDVLARIAGIFSGRGFNIENISANITLNPKVTKIIIVTTGDKATVAKIRNQLKKIVDVRDVHYLKTKVSVQREMILAKLHFTEDTRKTVLKAVEEAHGRIVNGGTDEFIVEVTGEKDEIDKTLLKFESLGMEDFTRSGKIAL
ncbi:MAG: acetolactate synthase small subunit [Deltaproteobacteria bacterium]|nr:acetolactate synthase small subunit [Deltaproteobacteria bacterium]